PAIGHEGDDRDGSYHCEHATESAEHTGFLVPESPEQERGKHPFRSSEKPARSASPENRVQPENKRAVADEWDQRFRLVLEPFLVPEEHEDEHHRRTDQVVVEVVSEKAGFFQDLD